MRLQAVLRKTGMTAGLIIGLSISAQALAVNHSNNSLLCAAYMDISVQDLAPLHVLPKDLAISMLVGRFTRLGAINLKTKEPVSDIVREFIVVRDSVRQDIMRDSQLNAMRLYSSDQVMRYAKKLGDKVTQHCTPSNGDIKELMKTYTKEDFAKKVVEVSEEMERQSVNGNVTTSDEIEDDADTSIDVDIAYDYDDEVVVDEPAY